ncbi:MAG: NAD-dependent protein deacylase, partial [Oscillospiraceae bacterium]
GVSTESGIPDFRSTDGLYNQKYKYPPEIILSHDFFVTDTEEFFRFYKDKMLFLSAMPNAAHIFLARLEAAGKLTGIVTQNIDGLHQKAGNRKVFELHGSVHRNYCSRCNKMYDGQYILNSQGIPRCSCTGILKPDVVLYDEILNEETVSGAINAIITADTMIVAGTSLTVYPAASLLQYFGGETLVLINRDETGLESVADLVIRENVGEVLSKIII